MDKYINLPAVMIAGRWSVRCDRPDPYNSVVM